MKIAMIASEANPFAKTGGLADVLGALSLALERFGHQVLPDHPGLPWHSERRLLRCRTPA